MSDELNDRLSDGLHAYLDGEVGRAELGAGAERDARAWDALLADLRDVGAERAPAGLQSSVMAAVRAEGRGAGRGRQAAWARPVLVRARPWLGWAAAAALAAVLLVSRDDVPDVGEPPGGAMAAASALVGEEVHYVQFLLEAPDATSVHVAGDFNDWQPEIELADPYGNGMWTGRVRLPPGVHKYMFLVDGETWITDPRAERYVEDGYGNRNAVIAITGGGGARSLAP